MIKVNFFAGLKRFFDAPVLLSVNNTITALEAIRMLEKQVPEATDLLSKCRVAINEEFIDLNSIIKPDSELFLIPPSSGG